MSQLPAEEAIQRFKENEERVDKFTNEMGTYQASGGSLVKTIRQFIADMIARYLSFNVKGAWLTGTAYAVQDIVSQSGTEYMCLVAHTSGTFATDLSAKKWAVYQGVTQAGVETLENKSFKGQVLFATNGSRVGITGASLPNTPTALVDIDNDITTCALRVTSTWTGSTASPYVNNDDSLWETFNRVLSNSTNYSWSISAPNAYNDIPAGVRDGGERVGVYGWATSVSIAGSFEHRGTLASQIGVRGRAGYQGGGPSNPGYSTAIVESAIGVKGEIYGEMTGPTVQTAVAGHFSSMDPLCTVQNNYAIYAAARGGTVANYSFFGKYGTMFQNSKAIFAGNVSGPGDSQVGANVAARGVNALEFGNPDPTGYASTVGATASSGYPFVAFNAEAESSGDTFRTRGKKGTVIMAGLDGSLLFGRITNANATGQGFTEDMRLTSGGKMQFAETVLLRSKTPESATATGTQGEFMWDENYLYVCVATNTWKRAALASW